MEYRRLGRSGLSVSALCLGAMNFGEQTDMATATRIFESAREAGVNFIDTADSYAAGESERMVGRLLGTRRDEFVLATKFGNAWGNDPNRRGLSRKWIL
ncbi:MAG: aldo/keto reductase, partial [Rhodocyclaceae bacterium]|nr:aldo/keto reductase [Rhodocyclaceae bacterium]